jgi:hypothetical protein
VQYSYYKFVWRKKPIAAIRYGGEPPKKVEPAIEEVS